MSINRSLHRIAQEGVIQTLEEKDKEIERLNNIINKIYRELEDKQVRIMNGESFEDVELVIYLKSKIRQLKSNIKYEIKELKGSDK